jgi:ketosteroid isomerase-like protein
MSRENVELTRLALDVFNRHDLEALLRLMDPDVEAVSRLTVLEGTYYGHDGIRRWWSDLFGTFPDLTTETVEVRELADMTISMVRQHGHGAGSDSPVQQELWLVTKWRDGKVVWWRSCETQAEALEAAGLRE